MYVSEGAPPIAEDASPIRLSQISGPNPPHVAPGERLRIRVKGSVEAPNGVSHIAVGVRMRSLPREEIVFAAHTAHCGLTLPDRGAFDLEIDVQMNVAPGTYRAQAVVWDLGTRSELTRGPSTLIAVASHASATGPVFAAPRMRFLDP
jgi:hypothetical protein